MNELTNSTGKVGITLNIGWDEPEDGSAENIAAAERSIQFAGGWFANPIFGSGDYPAVMKDQVPQPLESRWRIKLKMSAKYGLVEMKF